MRFAVPSSTWLVLGLLLLPVGAGCNRTAAQVSPAPTVEKPKAEGDLARTTLAPAAFRSLGIRVEPVRNEQVQEHVRLTGWVMARPGCEVTVTAPVAGYVRASNREGRSGVPIPGLGVGRGEELLSLEPVLAPVEQIQLAALKRGVENELAKAQESITAAESELQRVQGLHRQGLRGQQDVEQAQVRLKHAQADLAAAKDKLKLFAAPLEGGAEARLSPLAINAPLAGTVLAVHASPGQYVAAAAPLVTVADLGELWIRVPVPEYDLSRVDRASRAAVQVKPGGTPAWEAEPVAFVPQVDPARRAADILYKLTPSGEKKKAVPLARDQMVPVLIPLDTRRPESVVPYESVVFDAHAGSWLYLDVTPPKAAEHVFERRRVDVGPAVAGGVVVRPALRPEDRVVTVGAAALFSREFHKPPVATGAPKATADDDD